MKKKIYLVTGNHQLLISLKDYIYLIDDLLKEDYEIIQSKDIQNSCINLVIDECSEEKFTKQIINSHPNTIIIYFLTEFFTQSKFFKIKSFNYFSKNELILLFIKILSIYENFLKKGKLIIKLFLNRKIKLTTVKKRKIFKFYDYEMIKFKNFLYKFHKPRYKSKIVATFIKYLLTVILFIFLFCKYLIKFEFKDFLKLNFHIFIRLLNMIKLITVKLFLKKIDNYNFIKYMLQRRNGYEKIIHKIDFFLCTHKDILETFNNRYNKKIFFILNKLDSLKKNDYRAITISGESNSYRRKYISSLNLNYPNNFIEFTNTDFLIKDKFSRYSINPKKNSSWKFSSPMRYVLSINKNEIPIVTEEFSDDTSENLFLRMDKNLIKSENLDINYEIFIQKINSKIKKHNLEMNEIYFKVKKELELCFNKKIHSSQ